MKNQYQLFFMEKRVRFSSARMNFMFLEQCVVQRGEKSARIEFDYVCWLSRMENCKLCMKSNSENWIFYSRSALAARTMQCKCCVRMVTKAAKIKHIYDSSSWKQLCCSAGKSNYIISCCFCIIFTFKFDYENWELFTCERAWRRACEKELQCK